MLAPQGVESDLNKEEEMWMDIFRKSVCWPKFKYEVSKINGLQCLKCREFWIKAAPKQCFKGTQCRVIIRIEQDLHQRARVGLRSTSFVLIMMKPGYHSCI